MAGFFDSPLVRFLADRRGFYDQRDAQANAEQFQGLLGSLEQQGPTQPGQGVLGSRAPDQQFWLKAAQIPGYAGLAGQQLGIQAQGDQALERQTQGQNWSTQNMTLAQQQAQALDEQRAAAAHGISVQDLRRKWAGTNASIQSSLASAQNSGLSAQLNNERLFEQRNKNSLLGPDVPLYSKLPPVEQLKTRDNLLTQDTWASAAADAADWAQKRAPGAALPLAGTAEADAFNTEWQSSAKPAFMKILNTGVLQGKEAEQLEEIIGSPADKILTKSQINVIRTVSQKVQDLRENAYKAVGLQAPPIKKGSSAAARSMSKGQPQGKVIPILDIGDTGMPADQTGLLMPIQRGGY